MTVDIFAVPVFFITFRECIETSIIVSILLAFLKQSLENEGDGSAYKRLRKQVWMGIILGGILCLVIGGGMIGAFYTLSVDAFASTEDIWEGVFGIVAAAIISLMGAALLRVNKLQDKWRVKLVQALEERDESAEAARRRTWRARVKLWSEKHVMFMLPFVTVLREGLEAVVYIGGVSLGLPAKSFPLAVVCGLLAGCLIGYILYKGGNTTSLQIFLIVSTCFLYLVAAGLFSKAIWYFEDYAWNKVVGSDLSEVGSGPGSYDIRVSVWHVNCCNPELNGGGGWGIFNAVLGWTNSATIGSVVSYNLYWVLIILSFIWMRHSEMSGAPNAAVHKKLLARFRRRHANDVEGASRPEMAAVEEPVASGAVGGERSAPEGMFQEEKVVTTSTSTVSGSSSS